MATQQTSNDPFSIRSLLTLPSLDTDNFSTWPLSPFEKSFRPTTFALDFPEEEKLQKLQTHLFSLNLDDVPLPDLNSSTNSTVVSDAESDERQPDVTGPRLEEEEDVWSFPDVIHDLHQDRLLSWDNFVENNHTTPTSAYLSEAQAGAFSKTLCACQTNNSQALLKHAKSDILLSSLRELSLGRESVFFGYDSLQAAFTARHDSCTILDVSAGTMDGVVLGFMQLGNDVRALRTFVEEGPISPRYQIRRAFSAAIGIAVCALEGVSEILREDTLSLLQLQETIRKPCIMISSLRTLTKKCCEDTEDMGPLVQICDALSEKHPWMRGALQEIVARGVSCQIESIGQSIGLGSISVSSAIPLSETSSKGASTRNLLGQEITEVLVESRQGLALLKDSCPNHALLTSPSKSFVGLEWDYSWEAISKLQDKADYYEARLKEAILGLRQPSVSSLSPKSDIVGSLSCPEEQPMASASQKLLLENLEAPLAMSTELGNKATASQDTLYQAVSSALLNTDCLLLGLQPDLDQSISLSIMPMLTAQHRLLSYSILSLLFQTHNLRSHLLTQSRFQLLGDGLFASRLSHALFDSSQASGEGRRREGGRTGLRLQSRDTWPPASSELRLVLMGILSESISTENQGHKSTSAFQPVDPMLGCLSFAIRELSDEDFEKCRDACSIHALDFLALQYKASSPLLEAVITPRSLKIYDDIFMHLLRLLRLKSDAQELVRKITCRERSKSTTVPRDNKVRLEVLHFVSTLADWAQNTVIGPKWASFAATIGRVGECIDKNDYDGVLQVGKGLEFIKLLHEGVVDDIARTLFLKKKYTEVRAVLDSTFNIVLTMAKQMRTGEGADGETGNDETIQRHYVSFQKEVKSFLAYLRSNSSGIQGERDSTGPEAVMEQLALRLDMFGYYT